MEGMPTERQTLSESAYFRIERIEVVASDHESPTYQLVKTYKTPFFDNIAIYDSYKDGLQKCRSVFLLPLSVSINNEIYDDNGYEPLGDVINDLELSVSERLDVLISILRAIDGLESKGFSLQRIDKNSVYIHPITLAIKLFDFHNLKKISGGSESSCFLDSISESLAAIFDLVLTSEYEPNKGPSLAQQHPQVIDALSLLREGGYHRLSLVLRDLEKIAQYIAVLGICPRFDLNVADDVSVEEKPFHFNHEGAIKLKNILLRALQKSGGFYIIRGQSGVGKSTLIKKIISSQSDEILYVNHSSVDLEPYSTLDRVLGKCIHKFIDALGQDKVRKDLARYSEQLSLVSESVSSITDKKRNISDHDQLNKGKLLQELYSLTQIFLKKKLVVHFDDASYIDSYSNELLTYVSKLEATNLFLIIEDNTALNSKSVYDPSTSGDFRVFEFNGFNENDTVSYLESVLGSYEKGIQELGHVVHTATEGVPGSINSILKDLFDRNLINRSKNGPRWDLEVVKDYILNQIKERDQVSLQSFTPCEAICLTFLYRMNTPVPKKILMCIMGMDEQAFSHAFSSLFEKKHIRIDRDGLISIVESVKSSITRREPLHPQIDFHHIITNIISILLNGQDSSVHRLALEYLSKLGSESLAKGPGEKINQCNGRIALVVGYYCFNKKEWSLSLSFFEFLLNHSDTDKIPKNQLVYALRQCVVLSRIMGNSAGAERYFRALKTYGQIEEIAAASIDLIVLYKSKGKYTECVMLGIEMLKELGVRIPRKIGYSHIAGAFLLSKYLLSRYRKLVDLDKSSNRRVELKTQILIEIGIACYNASSEDENVRYELMMPYFALRCLIISLRSGYTAHSSHALVAYGLLCHMLQGSIDAAYKYYDIGKRVRDRFSDDENKDLGLEFYFHGMIQPWREPIRNAINALEEVKSAAFYHGQREFAGYLSGAYFALRITSGDNYQSILDALNKEMPKIAELKHQTAEYIHNIYHEHLVDVSSPRRIGDYEDIELVRERYGSNASVLFAALGSRMVTHYYAGNYDVASRYFKEANKRANTGGRGLPYLGFFRLLGSLNEIRRIRAKQRGLTGSPIASLNVFLSCLWLGVWTLKERRIFRSKFLLLAGEIFNTSKMPSFLTKVLFKKAIACAYEDKNLIESHIAHELYAAFQKRNKETDEALEHLSKAYDGYSDLGILIKCTEVGTEIKTLKKGENRGGEASLYSVLAARFNAPELDLITQDIVAFYCQCFLPSRVVVGINTGHVIRVCGEYSAGEYEFLNQDYLNYRRISRPLVSLAMDNGGVIYVSDPSKDHLLSDDSYSYSLDCNISVLHFGSSDKIHGFVYMEGATNNIEYLSNDNSLLQALLIRIAASLDAFQATKERDKAIREANLVKQRDSNLSHEIRTPLNGIANLSRLCINGHLDNETLNRYLGMINVEAEEVSYLVDDILTAKNIDEGNIILKSEIVNLVEILESVIRWFEINKRNERVEIERPDYSTLPEYIIADQTKIKQILRNLLNNALKFTHKGKVSVSLDVIANYDEQLHMLLKVKDTGCGIRPDQILNVFDKGYQAQTIETQGYRGNGIGLWLVKSFARKMAGDARISSKPGSGTEVFVTFKAKRAKDVPDEAIEIFRDVTLTQDKMVLVAEDHSANQEVIRALLAANGIAPVIVDDGMKAVKACEERSFDLVILDLNMPVMNGYQACEKIRGAGLNKHVPIVAISAHSDAVLAETKERGFDDYLTKPINEKEFNERMGRWISTSVNLENDDPGWFLEEIELRHLNVNAIREQMQKSPISFTITLQSFEESYLDRVLEITRCYPNIGKDKGIELFHQLASHAFCLGMDSLAKLSKLCEEKLEEGADIRREIFAVRLQIQLVIADLRLMLDAYLNRQEDDDLMGSDANEIAEFKRLVSNRSMKANAMFRSVKKQIEKYDLELSLKLEKLISTGEYAEAEELLEGMEA